MARWTEQQVAQLAPDAASVAAARKLAKPGPWSDTGSTDALVWGKCQGSGSMPYQVSIDLTGPAFKCSCPSRKFPCKHGLALLLLWVGGEGSVADAEKPAQFAKEWAGQRRERAEQAADRSTRPTGDRAPADPAAQAKRREQRLATMTAGMEEFGLWLADLVRNGLAGVRHQPYSFWDDAAARLVDAQLGGMAERVRVSGPELSVRVDWADVLLAELGRWWSATRAWARVVEAGLEAADPHLLGNLRAYLGWAYASDDIRDGDAVTDRWQVLGVHRTDDGRLQVQRTWLGGLGTGEVVLVLDFANVGGALGVAKVVGTVIDATVARYPGTWPRRALFVGEPSAAEQAHGLPAAGTVADALVAASGALALDPWLDRVPVTLAGVTLVIDPDGRGAEDAWVVDGRGDAIELCEDASPWSLLARTGGHPTAVFGELERDRFRPLSLALDHLVVPL